MTLPEPTDEDRELIERLQSTAAHYEQFPLDNTAGATMLNCRDAADRLESLLSDRAKLEEALEAVRQWFLGYAANFGTDVGEEITLIDTALNRSKDR